MDLFISLSKHVNVDIHVKHESTLSGLLTYNEHQTVSDNAVSQSILLAWWQELQKRKKKHYDVARSSSG